MANEPTATVQRSVPKKGFGRLGKIGGGFLLADLALGFGPGVVAGLREGVGLQESKEAKARNLQRSVAAFQHKQQLRVQELEKKMARNTVALAQADPVLFQSILAGRQIPQDGIVLGGKPRTDLLQEVAMQMSQSAPDPSGLQGLM